MKLVSFDPEVEHPVATVFVGGKRTATRTFGSEGGDWVFEVQRFLQTERPDLVLIEDQYMPALPSRGLILARAKSVFALVASRGCLECLCRLQKIQVELVNPLSWQTIIGGSKQGREKCKKASKSLYRSVVGMSAVTDDVADSFCIGWWWLQRQREREDEKSGV